MNAIATLAMLSPTDANPPNSNLPEDPLAVFLETASLDAETRNCMIAERAYYRAESRGFVMQSSQLKKAGNLRLARGPEFGSIFTVTS